MTVIGKELIRVTDSARRRRLLLTRLVDEELTKNRYWELRENAKEVLERWIAMESSGALEKKKEKSLDAEFLHEVFGKALGYRTASESAEEYELEREFHVPGIGTADAALACFPTAKHPQVIIELKGAKTDLDRDRVNGRTAVQQCWDYLNGLPDCQWAIVSNFRSIRLYHRDRTPMAYEEFLLKDLGKEIELKRFLTVLDRGSLVRPRGRFDLTTPRLLEETENRQRTVGDELYDAYSDNRFRLIEHLRYKLGKSVEASIQVAQKILDRIIFIAFCEDRGLLPPSVIRLAYESLPQFGRAKNPRWQNFLNLFAAVDQGHDQDTGKGTISAFNGGLFRHDPELDELQLADSWTRFFLTISTYDFRDEVNVDVLGHIFEKSIAELEKLREGGLFAGESKLTIAAKMPKSAERKRFGIYYTPPDFTRFIVENTVEALINARLEEVRERHSVTEKLLKLEKRSKKVAAYLHECLEVLRSVKICDPACGSGAFLIQAYDRLETYYVDIIEHLAIHNGSESLELYDQMPDFILNDNLFGVDVSPQSVEIAQLALWIRSARKGRTLSDLSKNIVWGNSLVSDPTVHARAMDWKSTFPQAFDREDPGFDCVIGNPPWERMKLQEREFFSYSAPDIAGATNAAMRRKLIDQLKQKQPTLFEEYEKAKATTEATLNYVRNCERFPFTAKGDVNTYTLFTELATTIVRGSGQIGLLIPSGLASDDTTREFFQSLIESKRIAGLFDFENREKVFADVDSRMKFCAIFLGGADRQFEKTGFVFFAHRIGDVSQEERKVELSAKDIALLNPNTKTCPIFRSRRDAEITKAIYRRVPVLIDENRTKGGNPWSIKFFTMFHQTNDAELFETGSDLSKAGFKLQGNRWVKGKEVRLPLYEAKMVQMYDHRAAGVVVEKGNWVRQGQTEETSLVSHQNPEFCAQPRWWVADSQVEKVLGEYQSAGYLCYKDVTSPTNQRTMIAAMVPHVALVNSAPLMLTKNVEPQQLLCLLANLNSFVYDFVARQKVGGVHLNFFIVKQLPTLAPSAYDAPSPWRRKTKLQSWISERAMKLSCTSNDLTGFAESAGAKTLAFPWNPSERAVLMAELDAAYFHLYGVSREDAEYILSTFVISNNVTDSDEGKITVRELILRKYDSLAEAMHA